MDNIASTAVEFNMADHSHKKISIENLEIDMSDDNKIYWIHADINEQHLFKSLIKTLHLPDDVVNLAAQEDSIPLLIDNDETLTIQIQCLLPNNAHKKFHANFSDLIIYITPKFCFTATSLPNPVIQEFMDNYHKAVRYAKTPCFILFLLFNQIVADYAKILFNLEVITDELDLEIHKSHRNNYKKVMLVKQQVMKVKRYIIATREILMRLSSRNITVISEQCRTSLYNLSNHIHMIAHETDSIRDMLNSLLDQIDNTLMQKMNETMRVLTAFAAIFLPLSLITGIYGMNFQWMPELHWKYGYLWALFLIVSCALFLLLMFKRKKWF